MTAYLLRRILFFVPTLLIITLLSFIISQSAPGDPVEQMLSGQQSGGEQIAERQANEAAYLQKRRDLGLDLPVFYFSIGPLAEPDTLYKIPKVPVQDALRRLVYKFGNWEAVQRYYQALLKL
jgi:ABC-type microcin C transport system permease subunit YejB